MLSSMIGMMNKASLSAAGTTLAAGTAVGGGGPGLVASIPVAMGAASGTTEALLHFQTSSKKMLVVSLQKKSSLR
jgi:hypothetical protein